MDTKSQKMADLKKKDNAWKEYQRRKWQEFIMSLSQDQKEIYDQYQKANKERQRIRHWLHRLRVPAILPWADIPKDVDWPPS